MDAPQTYQVKLEVFEGPLDLLLFLIRKKKLDIHEINLLVGAIVHEGRFAEKKHPVPRRLLGKMKKQASQQVRQIYNIERRFGVSDPVPRLDFRLSSAVNEWSRGARFSDHNGPLWSCCR